MYNNGFVKLYRYTLRYASSKRDAVKQDRLSENIYNNLLLMFVSSEIRRLADIRELSLWLIVQISLKIQRYR